ncbi:MAG: hypothetical protein D6759_11580, partial [Chloroflexi bacterium]
VIGSGETAQRAWFSEGTITTYFLAPGYVGYEATVLGRQVTVRLYTIAPAAFQPVGVVEVTLDDPTNARLVFASDLEPALSYLYAVEFRSTPDTLLHFDAAQQAIVGEGEVDTDDERTYGQPIVTYLYTDQPLHSWSANNLPFDQYLNADVLDGQIASGATDGRSALSILAQPVQHFYIGSVVLDEATRSDPSGPMQSLNDARLAALHQLPIVDAPDLPAFKFVSLMANLLNSYLINPGGRVYAVDKALIYAPDDLIPPITFPELLPDAWVAAYQDMLNAFASYQYTAGGQGEYWWKLDGTGYGPTPDWYAGNIPDVYYFAPDGQVLTRWQYSDAYSTAEFINAIADLYRVTGDLSFVQSLEGALDAALSALQTFDSAYDAEFGEDGNRFPNLLYPMSDLGTIQGEYPAESGQVIEAFRDGADLLEVLGRPADAQALRQDWIAPMEAAFDATFWDAGLGFYAPVADARSDSRAAGTFYQDKWCSTLLPPLRSDVGDQRLEAMLTTYTASGFYEPTNDVHWLSTDSENFYQAYPWTNGFVMEGGFFDGVPPALPPIGYYQLGQNVQADHYTNIFLNRWANLGPYETMMEYDYQVPGRFQETTIYIEPTSAPLWVLWEALGLQVDGLTVTIAPRMGGPFVVRGLRVTSQGLSATFDYARDEYGCEYLREVANEGLTLVAPQVGACDPTPTPTSTPTPTDTPTP